MSNPTKLKIAHFNDVYQVSEQVVHIEEENMKSEKIDVTKFASSLDSITADWEKRSDGKKDGLILFSGDLFSPSIESSTTLGGHMPAIVNALEIDVSVAGNHEFDFGFPHLQTLLGRVKFPWLLSNIIDKNTGEVPVPMEAFHVLERAGIRIGFIGLVEREWIPLITGWPKNFEFRDMVEVGKALSAKLRDPAGEYKCDFVIALTHAMLPNDIQLAKGLFALSPEAQKTTNIASEHGVDLIVGGHDHLYWISKGVTKWDGYDLQKPQPDAGEDRGDVLIVKSGTDFQDISEVNLTLVDTPPGSIRRKVIQEITGRRHVTREGMPVQEHMKEVLKKELATIDASWKEPVCFTEVLLDVRSSYIRTTESPIGNWITDCLRHSRDGALVELGYPTVDGVFVNSGSFRGDKMYDPGRLLMRDLVTVLPFPDPTVVIEVDANTLWDALEVGLKGSPSPIGAFPAISGFRVEWDSTKDPGRRVTGVWLLADSNQTGPDGKPVLVDKEEVTRNSTRKYLIMTGEYMSIGGDGYDPLKGQKQIIRAEHGEPKLALVKRFLLGALQLNRKNLNKDRSVLASGAGGDAHSPTWSLPISNIASLASSILNLGHSLFANAATGSASAAITLTSQQVFSVAISIAQHEEAGLLDGYERQRARMEVLDQVRSLSQNLAGAQTNLLALGAAGTKDATEIGAQEAKIDEAEELAKKSLPRIHPVVDGRLKDISKR